MKIIFNELEVMEDINYIKFICRAAANITASVV